MLKVIKSKKKGNPENRFIVIVAHSFKLSKMNRTTRENLIRKKAPFSFLFFFEPVPSFKEVLMIVICTHHKAFEFGSQRERIAYNLNGVKF
jgi:hypothetical protein